MPERRQVRVAIKQESWDKLVAEAVKERRLVREQAGWLLERALEDKRPPEIRRAEAGR